MKHLPLQVREGHRVVVDDPDRADARGGEILDQRAPQTPGADDEHAGALQPSLPWSADLPEDEMARVALDLLAREAQGRAAAQSSASSSRSLPQNSSPSCVTSVGAPNRPRRSASAVSRRRRSLTIDVSASATALSSSTPRRPHRLLDRRRIVDRLALAELDAEQGPGKGRPRLVGERKGDARGPEPVLRERVRPLERHADPLAPAFDVAPHVAPPRRIEIVRRGRPALGLEDRPQQERPPPHPDPARLGQSLDPLGGEEGIVRGELVPEVDVGHARLFFSPIAGVVAPSSASPRIVGEVAGGPIRRPILTHYQFAALVIAAIGPILALARVVGAPESLVLFGVGLGSAMLPGLPKVGVEPQFVLSLFLPPLLYASTVRVSWHLLRVTFLPGLVLGTGLVFTTIGAVAVGAHAILRLPWPGALMLGAVLAIFDTRLFHEAKGRPHVPRAISDTLKAREVVGRFVILATFALVVEAERAGGLAPFGIARHYALDIAAGLLLGIAVGQAVAWARERIDPAPVEIAVSVATPYASALLATALGVSVVASVTAAALVISAVRIDARTGATISSSEARLSATVFWEEASLILSSILFFLAGRALPEALRALKEVPAWRIAAAAAGLLALVVLVQFAFALAATSLPPISRALAARRGEPHPRVAAAGVMAWSSTRSVIGLVIALAIPAALPDGRPFPDRDLILVVAALAIVGSVLVQGLTLGVVAARARLVDEDEHEREKRDAQRAVTAAQAAPGPGQEDGFAAARKALLSLRERDRIGDETLIAMLRETDLAARATEGDALPGAGPPQP